MHFTLERAQAPRVKVLPQAPVLIQTINELRKKYHQAGVGVVLLNLSMLAGFYIGKLFNLSIPQRIYIAFLAYFFFKALRRRSIARQLKDRYRRS